MSLNRVDDRWEGSEDRESKIAIDAKHSVTNRFAITSGNERLGLMSETTPISGDLDGSRFTVDLGETNLTDEEVNGLQNAITRLIVETVRKKSSTATAKRKKPPYPKIIITHVRSTHVRSPTK